MRNTILAILLGFSTAAWAVTYKPYVNNTRTAAPRSTAVYDMPDFQFYSTSMFQSGQGYGSSRIAQQGHVRVITSQEKIGLQKNSGVGAGFNILGSQREQKTQNMMPQFLMEDISMRSTSTMLNRGGNRQDPTLSNARGFTTPLRVPGKPGTPDTGDPENQQPIGDALLPMLLIAMAYLATRWIRMRKHKAA